MLTGEPATFEELALAGKREMLGRTFVAQLDRLARLTLAALDTDHAGHDLSLTDVRRALVELTIALDVYRTYLDGAPPRASTPTQSHGPPAGPGTKAIRRWIGRSHWSSAPLWRKPGPGALGSTSAAAGSS